MSKDVLDTMIGAEATDPKEAKKQYREATSAEQKGDREAAVEHLRKAVEAGNDPQHAFKLAYLLDLKGDDGEAIALYERICDNERPPLNALINLAVLYEDRGDITRAERCLRQVLETDPNQPRARLFMKDVEASRDMVYDEEHVRDVAKRNALLDIPVTDFELSVRARNCLKKMNIRTLGDLLRISESELLGYKNFGETSLVEIKEMLTMKGLKLGQGVDGRFGGIRSDILEDLKRQVPEKVLVKPISVLDLSVRARKALQMLNIQTIGELASRTEAELLGIKNFGATSLVEINEKLGQHGLSLRKLD